MWYGWSCTADSNNWWNEIVCLSYINAFFIYHLFIIIIPNCFSHHHQLSLLASASNALVKRLNWWRWEKQFGNFNAFRFSIIHSRNHVHKSPYLSPGQCQPVSRAGGTLAVPHMFWHSRGIAVSHIHMHRVTIEISDTVQWPLLSTKLPTGSSTGLPVPHFPSETDWSQWNYTGWHNCVNIE